VAGHIFSTDLAEKLVWFVGLKNTIFCAHTPKEGVYLKVYGTHSDISNVVGGP